MLGVFTDFWTVCVCVEDQKIGNEKRVKYKEIGSKKGFLFCLFVLGYFCIIWWLLVSWLFVVTKVYAYFYTLGILVVVCCKCICNIVCLNTIFIVMI